MGRYDALERLVGEDAVSHIRQSRVLVVGAGGIGCEVLKDLVLTGFGEIHVVDLDTIDLSNLNRQFLFGMQHIKQSKAQVAAQVAAEFNTDVHVVPYEANIITDPRFTRKFFKSFGIVFNALDNAAARQHVNSMCVAMKVPLFDLGSSGFDGQCQVILAGESECYACMSHPEPTTFAVCTIRSTPTLPIHCVVWAKSFLFSMLFGPEDEQPQEEEASQPGADEETRAEISELMKERKEVMELKSCMGGPEFAERLITKLYVKDIKRLVRMRESIARATGSLVPTPLVFADIPEVDVDALSDQSVWSVDEALAVFADSAHKLTQRMKIENSIEFDKDDDVALSFVAAATMLREHVFGIPQQAKFKIKQMAGNIIPAIATTNAIVSGFGVIEAIKLVSGMSVSLRDSALVTNPRIYISGQQLQPPNPECVVCGVARTTFRAPPSTTLGNLVDDFLKAQLKYSDFDLQGDNKGLYDPEFDDLLPQTLEQLQLDGVTLVVNDDDSRRVNLEVFVDLEADSPHLDDVKIPLRPNIKRRYNPDATVEEEIDSNGGFLSAADAKFAGDGVIDLSAEDQYIDLT